MLDWKMTAFEFNTIHVPLESMSQTRLVKHFCFSVILLTVSMLLQLCMAHPLHKLIQSEVLEMKAVKLIEERVTL